MSVRAPLDETWMETPTPKIACLVPACMDKTFANQSNLKRHWVNSHVQMRPLLRCAIQDCKFIASSNGVFQDHLKHFHRYSFRDAAEAEKYCEKLSIENGNFVNPGTTPRPEGLELPSVHAYWRAQGKQTPAMSPAMTTPVSVLFSHPNPVGPTPTTVLTSNNMILADPVQLAMEGAKITPLNSITPASVQELEELRTEYAMPQVASTRDFNPLAFDPSFNGTPKDVRIVMKDPLNLNPPKKIKTSHSHIHLSNSHAHPLLKGLPIDGEDVGSREEDLQAACDQVDGIMEHLKKRRDTLKRKIRGKEAERIRRLEESNQALHRENAQLQERLIAARDIRREMDQQARSTLFGNNTPVGQAILQF